MIEVEVPELGIVEFPDDTPPDAIEGQLRQHFAGIGIQAATEATSAITGVLTNPAAAEASDISRRTRKKEFLADEKQRLQLEAEQGKAAEFIADIGERAAYTVSQMHPLKAIRPFVNPYGKTILPVEAAKTAIESIAGPAPKGSTLEAVQEFSAEMLSGLGQIENLPAFAAGIPAVARALPVGTMPVVGRSFQTEMISSLPEQIKNLQEAQSTGEAVKAGLGIAATGLIIAGIEKGMAERPLLPTDLREPSMGSTLEQPRGAQPPIEPKPLPELATPEQRAATLHENLATQVRQQSDVAPITAAVLQEQIKPVEKGLPSAEEIRAQVTTPSVEAPPVERGTEAGVRVGDVTQDRLATEAAEVAPINQLRDVASIEAVPATENGGRIAIMLPDGTAVVGGRIHADAWNKAVEAGVATDQQLSDGVAGFVKPDGTAWGVNGKPLPKVSKVFVLDATTQPKPPALPSQRPPEPKPPLLEPEAPAPSAAAGEIGNRVVEQPATQPPAIPTDKPALTKAQVSATDLDAAIVDIRKKIKSTQSQIRAKDKKLGVMTPPPIRAEVMGKMNKKLGDLQDQLSALESQKIQADKDARAKANEEAGRFDEDQDALITKIEAGEPVLQSEVDRLLQPDSEWRKQAKIEPTPPTVAKSATVESTAKIAQQVKETAVESGQRAAKEIKSELVQRLEQAIKDAPEEAKGKLTIEIPGDGTFTVPNGKSSLEALLKRAKQIDTRPGETKPDRVPTGKSDLSGEADKIVQAYGGVEEAYRTTKRQRDALPDNDPETPAKVTAADALLNELYGRTKAGIAEAKADNTRTILATYKEGAESFRREIARLQAIKRKKQSHLDDIADTERRYAENQKRIAQYEADIARLDQETAREKAALEAQPPPTPSAGGEMVGMGGAVPKEFERGQGSPTAMKYRLIDQERQKRGLEPLAKSESVSDQATMDRAMAAIDADPALPERLVRELNQKPRVIEDWENHVLLLRKIDLREAYHRSAREAMQAFEDSKQFPERLNDVNAANERTQFYSNELTKLEQASRVSGSARGRALRSLRVMANEDYSLAALEMEARSKRNWRELTPDERAELIKIADEHKAKSEALEKRLAEVEKEQADKDAQIVFERAKSEALKEKMPSQYVLDLVGKIGVAVHERAEAARARLREKMSRMTSGVDPTILVDLAEIGAEHVFKAGKDFTIWSARMVSELGDWVKPHLKEVWDASQKALKKTAVVFVPKRDAAAVDAVVGKKKIETIDTVKTKIQKRLEKVGSADPRKKLAEISHFIRRLGRLFVQEGVKERNELVDKVHEIVNAYAPELSRRDTLDILAGYGDYSPLPKDAVSIVYRDLKGQLQQVAKLEDMAKGESPMRSGVERRTPSDEERRLQKQVEEAKRKGGYVQTDPELQLRTAMQEVQRRLENEIADLDYQIQNRTKIVKDKTKLEYDEPTKRLQAIRDEKRALFNEIFKKPEMTEAERLAKWKERTRDRMTELQEILEGKRQPKKRRPAVELDKEALRLSFEKNTIERQVREKFAAEAWKQKHWLERLGYNIWDVGFNVPRALLTSGELSAVLRQGKLVIAGHPIMGLKSIGPMFRAAFSEKAAFEAAQKLIHRENAPLYQRSGLDFTEHGGKLSSMEEAFMSRIAPKIPGVGRFVRGSERAYITFLNKLRADYFDYLSRTLTVDGKGNPVELKHIANLVNVATGRGGKSVAKVASAMNSVFFSPRYSLSRFQYLLGQPLRGGTFRTKRIVAGEYARQLMGIAGVLSLAAMAGFEIGTDRKSSDFGKIIIGDTRIDTLAGLAQVFVLLNRLASGEKTTRKGKTVAIRRTEGKKLPYGADDASDVLLNFVRQKAAPTPSLAINLLSGQNAVGQYFGPQQLLQQSLVPITYSDIYNVMKEHDLPTASAAALLAFFGEGVNTYQDTK